MAGFAPLLWIIFFAALLMYATYGVILSYHWTRWSHNVALTTIGIASYVGVGVFLFGVMSGALLSLSV